MKYSSMYIGTFLASNCIPLCFFASLSALILGNSLLSDGYFFALDWYFSPKIRVAEDFFGLRGYEKFIYAELPFLLFLKGLDYLIPAFLLQKIMMFLIFFVCGFSAYIWIKSISPEAGYFAGILYMINPFTYVRFLSGQWGNLMAYAFMPLAIASLMKFLEKSDGRNALLYVVWISIITIFSIQMALLTFFVCFFLFVPYIVFNRKSYRLKHLVKSLTLIICFYLALNSYWLIPVLTAKNTVVSQFTEIDLDIFSAKPEVQNIYYTLISLHGFWRGGYQYTFNIINGWHFIALAFIFLSIIGFFYNFEKEFYRPYLIGFALCMTVALILATGVSGVFKPINIFLFKNFTLFRAFRDTHKFVVPIILGYVYLGGLGVARVISYVKKLKRVNRLIYPIVFIAMVSIPIIYQFNMLFAFNGQLKTCEYPKSWYDINDFLNADKDDYNILFFPWHNYMYFSWIGSKIANPAKAFFDKPVIQAENMEVGPIYTRSTNPAQHYLDFLLSKSQSINNFGELISILNVKYILLTKETDYKRYFFLYNQTDLKPVLENKDLIIFKNEKYAGRIYSPESILKVRNFEDILNLSKITEISRSAIICQNIDLKDIQLNFHPINYSQDSPIFYRILETNDIIVFTPPNLNANGWKMGEKASIKTLGFQAVFLNPKEISIMYERFNVYSISYIISIISLVVVIIYAIISHTRKVNRLADINEKKDIAVFLDRDGTICRDVHYMSKPEQFELLPKVAEGIRLLNELGVKVIVITNQSGIARGYFTEEDLNMIHERMRKELATRGAKIDAIYYCPHHPNDGCDCRKPKIGLFIKAAKDFNLHLKRCFMIGDRELDIKAGWNAGCTSILLPSPETENSIKADYTVPNLYEAAKLIKKLLIS